MSAGASKDQYDARLARLQAHVASSRDRDQRIADMARQDVAAWEDLLAALDDLRRIGSSERAELYRDRFGVTHVGVTGECNGKPRVFLSFDISEGGDEA